MSIKERIQQLYSKNKVILLIIAVALFSFTVGYLLAFELNPVPVIIEKCSTVM